jgi:hypothetical protein
MVRAIVVVLLVAAVAFAQPEPFVAYQTAPGASLHGPRVCLRDTAIADVFWVRHVAADSEEYIEHAVVSLAQRQLISGPEVIQHTEDWSQQIGDVISRGEEGWAAVLYELRLHPWGSVPNRLFFTGGRDTELFSTLLDSATQWYVDCAGWGSSNMRIGNRVGGGWIMSWIRNGCQEIPGIPGASEPESSIQLGWVSSDFAVETRAACCIPDYPYGPEDVRTVSLDPDTVATLSLIGRENVEGMPAGLSWQPFDEHMPSQVQLSCSTAYVDFQKTHGNRLLALTSSTDWPIAISNLREIHRDGTCDILQSFTPPFDSGAIVYNPDYGFAIASVANGSVIMLARIDTTGAEVQPIGVFYERDADHLISQADVTIANDGRVVIMWTEQAVGSQDVSISKAAWVGWDTFLSVDDPRSVPKPSSFTLSCSPNPFNSTLDIRYDLPRAQQIELSIYNLLGQKVATLFDGMKAAGAYRETWTPNCGTGIYFVSLKTKESSRTAKVVYLR